MHKQCLNVFVALRCPASIWKRPRRRLWSLSDCLSPNDTRTEQGSNAHLRASWQTGRYASHGSSRGWCHGLQIAHVHLAPCPVALDVSSLFAISLSQIHIHIYMLNRHHREQGGTGRGRIQHTGAPFLIPTPSSRPRMVTYGWPLIICWMSTRTVLGSLGPGLK